MLKRLAVLTGIVLSSLTLASCDGIKDTFGVANRTPVIASFDYSPKSGVTKNDVITFTVVANDPEGKPLQFNWTATKGILSANSGNTVSWRPIKLDGSFETGLSNVSVLVSDGVMTNSANVNIFMQGDSVTIATPNVSASPSASPSPSVSASVAPSASASVTPTASSTPVVSPTATTAPTASPTVAPTATVSPVSTPVPSESPTASVSPSPSVSATPVPSPTATASSTIVITQ